MDRRGARRRLVQVLLQVLLKVRDNAGRQAVVGAAAKVPGMGARDDDEGLRDNGGQGGIGQRLDSTEP
jgi:hypothetical protein